jgi:hypothetical protein
VKIEEGSLEGGEVRRGIGWKSNGGSTIGRPFSLTNSNNVDIRSLGRGPHDQAEVRSREEQQEPEQRRGDETTRWRQEMRRGGEKADHSR